jgi:hypothetical protein
MNLIALVIAVAFGLMLAERVCPGRTSAAC